MRPILVLVQSPSAGTEAQALSLICAVQQLWDGDANEHAVLSRACESLTRVHGYRRAEVIVCGPGGPEVASARFPEPAGLDEPHPCGEASFRLDDLTGTLRLWGSGDALEGRALLQALAATIGHAFGYARLRHSVAIERERARRNRQRLDALWELTVARNFDLYAQIRSILTEGARQLAFEWANFARVDATGLFVEAVVGDATIEKLGNRSFPFEETLGAKAIARNETLVLLDAASDAEHAANPSVVERGIRAFAATPFRIGGTQYVMCLGSSTPRTEPLERDDLSYIDLLVAVLARALQARDDQARIRYLLRHDPLTGLPNRERFMERLDDSIERSRHADERFALALIDVDRVRHAIQQNGTESGDEIMMQLARRIAGALHKGQELFRFSGDAFAMLTPHVRSEEEVESLARSIVGVTGEKGRAAFVGMALYPDDGEAADTILLAAGSALRRAMEGGGAEYRFHSGKLDDRLARRRRFIEELRGSIDRNELLLYYQPWVELGSRRIVGAEALLRWQHPRRGLIEPTIFVSLAEETDLIWAIGAWVIEQTMRQARSWTEDGRELVFSINLSPRQFDDPLLRAHVGDSLARFGTNPAAIEFEVTESIAMRDPVVAQDALTKLRALGVRIALDDFGTGHSSLAYLKYLPIDILKVDKSFVHGLPHERSDAAIARAVIALGTSIGCEVRAEGIETEAQALWLHAAGCETGQGFWLAHPMPPKELRAFARARN